MLLVKASFTHKKRKTEKCEFYHLTLFHQDRLYRVYTDFMEFMVIEYQEESEERISKKEKKDIETFIENKKKEIKEKKDLPFFYINYTYKDFPVLVKRRNIKKKFSSKVVREEIPYTG